MGTAPDEPAPNYGEVFTRRWVVDTLLDLAAYTSDRDLGAMKFVEPSVGRGAFLLPALERLIESARHCGRSIDSLGDAITGFDVQPENVAHCRAATQEVLEAAGCDSGAAGRLAQRWLRESNYLLDDAPLEADVVAGNPPYIRLEDLDDAVSDAYRRQWTTMSGRADIYVGFFERSLQALRPGGRVAFICADRWMRNQYGARLRAVVGSRFAVENVWTMHDVDAFEEKVAAYPAITVLRNAPQGPVVAATTDHSFGAAGAADLAKWAEAGSGDRTAGVGFAAYRLPHWFPADEMWPSGSPARLALVEKLDDEFEPIQSEETGTKVGIGVATGADKVFVTADPDVVEADRLLPLAMGTDLRTGLFEWSGHYLVNPWSPDGALVDLDRYPRLRRYYEEAGAQLKGRHTAKKSPTGWFRTIDKVNHALVDQPKLLLRDMGASINPVLETGGFYPHHNVYFIVSSTWDMEVLGGLLLSRVAQAFIEAYCVRMRGDTLRFQAQYLRRIRVPRQDSIDAATSDALRDAFRRRDSDAATDAAAHAYGVEMAAYELDRQR